MSTPEMSMVASGSSTNIAVPNESSPRMVIENSPRAVGGSSSKYSATLLLLRPTDSLTRSWHDLTVPVCEDRVAPVARAPGAGQTPRKP